jgi:glycosyltransferase involved in cell wall biosynthesis
MHFRKTREAFLLYMAQFGRPDVLHAHSVFPAAILTHRLATEFKIPFIVTEHRPSSIERLGSRWLRRHGTAAAYAADRRVAVSPAFAAELERAYGKDLSWTSIPGLLSPQFESAPPRSAPLFPPFVFGHVSHLDSGKRVDMLIQAFADQFAGDAQTRLRIVGDSCETHKLKRLSRELGVESQIHFAGAVSRASIAEEFAQLHSFVLPSRVETFGTVMWEAMALGIPVVSSRTWAGMNAISDDVGLLFDIDDRAQLGSMLARMRATYQDYDGQRIRKACIEHCGKNTFNNLYLRAYTQAIHDGPSFPRANRKKDQA